MSWPPERSRHGGVDEVPVPRTAGRLWLCGKHFVGPDPEAALATVRATAIVCLSERHELAERYPSYVAWLEANQSVRAVWWPVPDLHAPPVDAAGELLDVLGARLDRGEGLLLHCGAGIGRAGTIAAAVLLRRGVALDDARAAVASCRPLAGPEAGPQADLLVALSQQATRLR